MKLAFPFAVLFCAACGGSSPPANAPSSTTASHSEPQGAEGHQGKDHHDDLAPPLRDFHGVIAPVWHTPAGAPRVEKACASSKSIVEKAQATTDAELIAAAGALDPACAAAGRPDVEAKLGVVHERFHALAKMGKHDEKHEEKH